MEHQQGESSWPAPVGDRRLPALQYPIEPPPMVAEALRLAARLDFAVEDDGRRLGDTRSAPSSSIPAVGRLLRTLVAARPGGRMLETGAGAGVGAAWMASGLVAGATLTTCEIVPELATGVAGLFTDRDDVTVLAGDWTRRLTGADPFDLVFLDGMPPGCLDPEHWRTLLALVAVGGMIVIDDVTPERLWPDSWRGRPDPKREFAFRNPAVAATEVETTERTSALLIVRLV